jgi:DMSO/TMAO reductase YedYZ molybdopterin-dependent catalytic subunit
MNGDREPSLSISGEVERPVSVTAEELRALADGDLVADFHCREGWSRLGEHWRGVRLSTLLGLAGARDAGHFVTVGSGGYCFLSVKSVDRIELTPEPAQATAAGIALARLER